MAASQLALSNSYYENVLAQARRSFIAAIISAAIGLAFFVTAVLILVLHNDVRAGTVSAISGGVVEVISGLNFWLYGRTAIQLNAFHVRLDQTQKFLIANSIATKLDGAALETALISLINQVAGSQNRGEFSDAKTELFWVRPSEVGSEYLWTTANNSSLVSVVLLAGYHGPFQEGTCGNQFVRVRGSPLVFGVIVAQLVTRN